VISVSEAMATIAIYRNDKKHTFKPRGWLIDRATQALSTLQRFKRRFDLALATLSGLEMADSVSVGDVIAVLQPGEMVVRIAEEIETYLVELGEDGRLIGLQLAELESGTNRDLRLVVRDYVQGGGASPAAKSDGRTHKRHAGADRERRVDEILALLHDLSPDELLDPEKVGSTLGLASSAEALDAGVEARGYRLLHRLPKISDVLVERIVERFAALSGIMQASLGELEKVEGVGAARARSVKDGLARMVEASILERYE
jgi:diadenylate cyclase